MQSQKCQYKVNDKLLIYTVKFFFRSYQNWKNKTLSSRRRRRSKNKNKIEIKTENIEYFI